MTAYRPLTCKQVKQILTTLGFKYINTEGSHEQWKKYDSCNNLVAKVTVDCPNAPFSRDLTFSMIRQAKVSKNDWFAALN